MTTGFIYSKSFLNHDTGSSHPECAARLSATMTHLTSLPLYRELKQVTPLAADMELIESNHHRDYLARARQTCLADHPYLDSMDVAVCRESFEIALLAAGSGITLADSIMSNDVHNGFALVRPPGHHAESNQALGFCLLNNIAIVARHLQSKYQAGKIVILDWDVHHGNGTQHSFEEDPAVFYISTHQYPYYPGTGASSETGTGRGAGATLNYPMFAGSGDSDYETAFTDVIMPAIDRFKPDFILVSAGFDAHVDDPLAQINLSTGFFGWMTERLLELADKHCQGRLLSLLEGGYNLQALPLCIEEHLRYMTAVN